MTHSFRFTALILVLSAAGAHASVLAGSVKGMSATGSSPAAVRISDVRNDVSNPVLSGSGFSGISLRGVLDAPGATASLSPSARPRTGAVAAKGDAPREAQAAPAAAGLSAPETVAVEASALPRTREAAGDAREIRSNTRGRLIRKAAAEAAPWLNDAREDDGPLPAAGPIASVNPARNALARVAAETPAEAAPTGVPPAPSAPKGASKADGLVRILGANPTGASIVLAAVSGALGAFLGGAGIVLNVLMIASPVFLLLHMMLAPATSEAKKGSARSAFQSVLALAAIAVFTTAAWSVLGVRVGEWTLFKSAFALSSGTALSAGIAMLTYSTLEVLLPARFFKKDPPKQTALEFAARHAFALAAAVAGLAAAGGALLGGLPLAVDGWMGFGWGLMMLGSVFSWPRHILRLKPRAAAVVNSLATLLGVGVVAAGMAGVTLALFLEGWLWPGLASGLVSAGISTLGVLLSGKLVKIHLSAGLAGKHPESVLSK